MDKKYFALAIGIVAVTFGWGTAVLAATLSVDTVGEPVVVGDEFTVRVALDTAGVAINAASGTLSFPEELLEVVELDTNGVFTLWTATPSFSNTNGTVTWSGGLPSPGYNGADGTIITATFRPIAAGEATLSIRNARVLANDGQGTDVLTGRQDATVTIASGELPEAPVVTSTTHPASDTWYAANDVTLSWTVAENVEAVSYTFDQNSTMEPDETAEAGESVANYSAVADGVWYFHIRAYNRHGWGLTRTFPVRVDTTPPQSFSVTTVEDEDGDVTALSFVTTDVPSGVQYYVVTVGDLPAVQLDAAEAITYQLSDHEDGEWRVTVLAVDYAGNSTRARTTFEIGGGENPVEKIINQLPPVARIAENIVQTIERALPAPIRAITRQVNETINTIRDNEAVANVVTNVVEPAVTAATVVVVTGAASTTATLQVGNAIYMFFRFGYFWIVPMIFGKKRKPWGTVFDSTSARPVKRAVIRIFSKDFDKLKETQITDAQGRFGFLVDAGRYYVTATSPGFQFPSALLTTSAISQYHHIYRGEVLTVAGQTEQALSINIPMDPSTVNIPTNRIRWLKLLNFLGLALDKINMPLLIGGTVLSWASLIIAPSAMNYIFLVVYGLLILLKFTMTQRMEKSWGGVIDEETKKPIGLAVVRIYSLDNGAMAGTRVTNQAGHFQALVPPGQYYLMVLKSGYAPFQSDPFTVAKDQGYIKQVIALKKQTVTSAPVQPPAPAPAVS